MININLHFVSHCFNLLQIIGQICAFDGVAYLALTRTRLDVMLPNSVPNLSKIGQSTAELLTIYHVVADQFETVQSRLVG